MSAVIVDTSVWIEFLAGRPVPTLEDALAQGLVVLPPVVVAELISGARRPRERAAIADLIEALPLHETPVEHWIRAGELRRALLDRGVAVSTPDAHVAQCALDRGALRRRLLDKGIAVSTPDAHVAQCALDRDALLLSRDAVFTRIAAAFPLRVRTE